MIEFAPPRQLNRWIAIERANDMYYFTIRSRINPKSKTAKEFSHAGGAYVGCYICFKDFNAAEKLAKLLIREEGWIPEKRTEGWKLQKNQLKTKKQKQYYSEAIKYGYTLVFNTWPKGAKDAHVDYEANLKE